MTKEQQEERNAASKEEFNRLQTDLQNKRDRNRIAMERARDQIGYHRFMIQKLEAEWENLKSVTECLKKCCEVGDERR